MDKFTNSKKFFRKSSKLIPLGSETFSKSIKVLPFGVSPLYTSKAKSCNIWDVDNNKYLDFCNALASVIIGYADKNIDCAVKKQMKNGVTFSLSHIIETKVAKKIIDIVPSAEMLDLVKTVLMPLVQLLGYWELILKRIRYWFVGIMVGRIGI